jgi:glutathione synthase/RimK-type ligase-like ATP-grasp enzyme
LTEISLLYDQSETDELGIKLTADQMGIKLSYLPFYKAAIGFNHQHHRYYTPGKDYTRELNSTKVVLNRCQSKSRRIFGTTFLESFGKYVLNSLKIELNCQSKIRTLLAFAANGVKIPRTVYASPNVKESVSSTKIHDNTDSIISLITQELGEKDIVVKPDAGTHGRGVIKANNVEELQEILGSVVPGITHPSGVVAQELIHKWFYDLRIIVVKENGRSALCHKDALSRCGFKDFRTNTFLGNMVVRARLPNKVQKEAEKAANIIGSGCDSWVIALDAMPSIPLDLMECENELRENFNALENPFGEVTKIKRMPDKKRRFREYTEAITEAYTAYMHTEPYSYIESVVNSTLDKTVDNVYFHEANACPEFWEQTRIFAGINPAAELLRCAQSILDR